MKKATHPIIWKAEDFGANLFCGSPEAMESETVSTVKGKWEPEWSSCRTKPNGIPMPSLRP